MKVKFIPKCIFLILNSDNLFLKIISYEDYVENKFIKIEFLTKSN